MDITTKYKKSVMRKAFFHGGIYLTTTLLQINYKNSLQQHSKDQSQNNDFLQPEIIDLFIIMASMLNLLQFILNFNYQANASSLFNKTISQIASYFNITVAAFAYRTNCHITLFMSIFSYHAASQNKPVEKSYLDYTITPKNA